MFEGGGSAEVTRIDAAARCLDYPDMIVTMDAKRRLTVPEAMANVAPGNRFEARFDAEQDAIVFRRVVVKADWLAVLRECPVPIDIVRRRRREFPRRRV
jgi:hypothetical protein